jgi:hypothetical protein
MEPGTARKGRIQETVSVCASLLHVKQPLVETRLFWEIQVSLHIPIGLLDWWEYLGAATVVDVVKHPISLIVLLTKYKY